MKSFECKLKGRPGTGKDDLKEMRVLNRIVRITIDALLYEADPRHAEMLIKTFQLEDSKAVVTPGVKVNVDGNDDTPIDADHDPAIEINRIISELKYRICSSSKVQFVRSCYKS